MIHRQLSCARASHGDQQLGITEHHPYHGNTVAALGDRTLRASLIVAVEGHLRSFAAQVHVFEVCTVQLQASTPVSMRSRQSNGTTLTSPV